MLYLYPSEDTIIFRSETIKIVLGGVVFVIRVSGPVLSHVSSRHMTSVSVREGACPVELRSFLRLRMIVRDDGMEKACYDLAEEPISIVFKFVFIHCHRESCPFDPTFLLSALTCHPSVIS